MTSTTSTRSAAIDASHTHVGFSVRHLMIARVRGSFGAVTGSIDLPVTGQIPTAVTAEVEIASINTRDDNRDTHLKSADFFEVETYPTMKFVSTSVTPKGDTAFELAGTLTLHGVTHPVILEAESSGQGKNPFGPGERFAFEAKGKIKRSDFGLTWNSALEAGGVAISDDVEITLDVEAVG